MAGGLLVGGEVVCMKFKINHVIAKFIIENPHIRDERSIAYVLGCHPGEVARTFRMLNIEPKLRPVECMG